MKSTNQQRRKKWAASILSANIRPVDKVRKLVALGYDEDDAERMVSGQLINQQQPVYYEQLPNPEYAPEDEH